MGKVLVFDQAMATSESIAESKAELAGGGRAGHYVHGLSPQAALRKRSVVKR